MRKNAYEQFEEKVRTLTIDKVRDLPCPNCGGELDYVGEPDETYMADDTFVRNEVIYCCDCGLNIEVEQVYKPVKCYVERFDDEWCEKEDEA